MQLIRDVIKRTVKVIFVKFWNTVLKNADLFTWAGEMGWGSDLDRCGSGWRRDFGPGGFFGPGVIAEFDRPIPEEFRRDVETGF